VIAGAATRDEALVGAIDLAGYAPGPIEVAVAADGNTAIVTVGPGFFAGPVGPLIGATEVASEGTALVVDLAARAVVAELPPPASPMGVAVSPDGKRAFTADYQGSTLSVIDLSTLTLATSVEVGGRPEEASIAPDGRLGVVNTDSDESIRFFDPEDPAGSLSGPLRIGGDPGGAAFVPGEQKLVIGKSLPLTEGDVQGFAVVDVARPGTPSVLEHAPITDGIPYGAELVPGTSRVLLTLGMTQCSLREVDVATDPATIVRTLDFGCAKASLPMSAVVDREGKHAFVGMPGENALGVASLETGETRLVPWLASVGPTDVALTR
jgi:YVTN family beta-propeller protein